MSDVSKLAAIESMDEQILDAIDLMRLMFPDFNSVPLAEKVVLALVGAYRASGKLADAIDHGWIE